MKCAVGQDSHRFEDAVGKPCVLAGVVFPDTPGFLANSDGDVVLHAVTNAVSGLTGVNILGARADELCRAGMRDSRVYLAEALRYLDEAPVHLSVSIEGLRPKIAPRIPEMKEQLAELLGLPVSAVGITATTGEGLTACGRGEGVSVICILTAGDKA